jgi:hypothetical protein
VMPPGPHLDFGRGYRTLVVEGRRSVVPHDASVRGTCGRSDPRSRRRGALPSIGRIALPHASATVEHPPFSALDVLLGDRVGRLAGAIRREESVE